MFNACHNKIANVSRAILLSSVLATTMCAMTPQANAANYLHTSGNKILDSNGNVVRLTGVSWFGMETANYCPHGLWQYSMNQYLDQIKSLGFNSIRVPYCNQLFDAGSTPNGINNQTNADLVGLTGIQIMDLLVSRCQTRGIKIILDRHRPDSGAQSALWYTAQYSEARWISDWQMLVTRYNGNDTVVGCDLHNEPHDPASWGDGNAANDWRAAAQRCGNAILAINPKMLIVVEGIQTYAPTGDSGWWGGNLEGVTNFPVTLNVPNQVVYSPHDYPASVFNQTWFSAPNYPANLGPSVWDPRWGYITKNNIAPVWVGEFGTLDVTTSDQQWFSTITNYMTSNGMSWAFWSWNPDSGDTGGILKSDWLTVESTKMAVLTPILAPFIGSGPPTIPAAPTGLIATAGNAQVVLGWAGSSGATSYNVSRSTVSGSGYASVATGITTTAYTNTGLTNGTTYYFVVSATNSAGTSANSAQASAKPTAPAPPAVPTGLAAAAGNAQVSLTWNASSGATSYNVSRSTVSGSGYVSVATGITVTNYNNTGLTNGTTYYFVVSATNAAGTSANSAQASATPNVSIPAAPTGLAATSGNAQVGLTWSASSGATSYSVYRGTAAGGESTTAIVSGLATTSYTNTGLTNGTAYFYKVKATNAAGTSGYSNEASATPAAVTSSLKVQYLCGNVTTPGNQIQPYFEIFNTGTTSVALSTLKIRYYYTIDTTQPQTFFCDYALVGNGNVSATFNALSPVKTNADTYLEVSFNAAAGSIAANGNSGPVQCRFNKNDFSNYTQTNDYSFDATKTAYADWNKAALYQNGTLVWGVTPP